MSLPINNLLRQLPKVDELLAHPLLSAYAPSPMLTQAVRHVLDELRRDIKNGIADCVPTVDSLASLVIEQYGIIQQPSLRRVINGTGIILHTNLGRAPLAQEVLDDLGESCRGYSNLEYNIDDGKRSSRYVHVEELLTRLTGAEAAMVVNNNAAAVLLALSAVATSRKTRCPQRSEEACRALPGEAAGVWGQSPHFNEVVVSRGELVEIGGSFRIPDVMEQSGCRLVEVGTTNKTHPSDYVKAIHPERTGALLRVHTSNFAVIGFVAKPSLAELSEIATAHNIPLIEDLGSGCLINLAPYGIHAQPIVSDSIKAGVDIVTFSGDKLLGGPQAGIIVGKAEYIAKMKSHPLTRAFRIDKLCLSALETTLRLYQDPAVAVKKIPTLAMLCACPGELLEKARALKTLLGSVATVVRSESKAGGGAMPEENLTSYAVSITVPKVSPQVLEGHFRANNPPIIGRITYNQFLLDVRTINKEDFPTIAECLNQSIAQGAIHSRVERGVGGIAPIEL